MTGRGNRPSARAAVALSVSEFRHGPVEAVLPETPSSS
jgi:fructoselysine-6-P-deglycase FrlB-like protein